MAWDVIRSISFTSRCQQKIWHKWSWVMRKKQAWSELVFLSSFLTRSKLIPWESYLGVKWEVTFYPTRVTWQVSGSHINKSINQARQNLNVRWDWSTALKEIYNIANLGILLLKICALPYWFYSYADLSTWETIKVWVEQVEV